MLLTRAPIHNHRKTAIRRGAQVVGGAPALTELSAESDDITPPAGRLLRRRTGRYPPRGAGRGWRRPPQSGGSPDPGTSGTQSPWRFSPSASDSVVSGPVPS